MRRECRECFRRHRLHGKPLVSDPGIHYGTCVTHVPWCISGSLSSGGGENVHSISGACATRNFTHLVRGPFPCWYRQCGHLVFFMGEYTYHFTECMATNVTSLMMYTAYHGTVSLHQHKCCELKIPPTYINGPSVINDLAFVWVMIWCSRESMAFVDSEVTDWCIET